MATLHAPFYLNDGETGNLIVNTSNLAVSIVASSGEIRSPYAYTTKYLYAKIQYSRYQSYGGGNISPNGGWGGSTTEYHGSFANTGIPVNRNTSYKVSLHQNYYGTHYDITDTGWFTMP